MKTDPRKSWNSLLCALFVSALCYGAADPETLYNGTYRIEPREGGQVSTASSQFLLKAGEKARARMEPTDVELWVSPVSDQEYDLHMIITVAPNKTALRPTRVDKVYRGRFAMPLELGSSQGNVHVKGSVSVLRYRPRA